MCFIFLISKRTNIYIYIYIYEERKGHLQADPKHTGCIQEAPKSMNKKKRGYKKSPALI